MSYGRSSWPRLNFAPTFCILSLPHDGRCGGRPGNVADPWPNPPMVRCRAAAADFRGAIAHYDRLAEGYWTALGPDVNQNYAALLDVIEAIAPIPFLIWVVARPRPTLLPIIGHDVVAWTIDGIRGLFRVQVLQQDFLAMKLPESRFDRVRPPAEFTIRGDHNGLSQHDAALKMLSILVTTSLRSRFLSCCGEEGAHFSDASWRPARLYSSRWPRTRVGGAAIDRVPREKLM